MTLSPKRIDHLVLAVRDLDAAGAHYDTLGFQVGTRNRHPWGTENRIVQFQSSFLELIAVGDASLIPDHRPGHFSFGAFVRDYLARREGLAMLVLDSDDAKADASRFAEEGIGAFEPFFFERKGRRPDGSETHVAFTLAFALDPNVPQGSFFVCQQHYPEAFWNPAFQQHANGAVNVSAVTVEATDPARTADFLRAFSGGESQGPSFLLRHQGRIDVSAQPGEGRLTGFTIAVPELAVVAARLRQAGIAHTSSADAIRISENDGFGVQLQFKAME
ncbi:VOC family protein [Affinirhizobium pseudoryzae]|uniref:VOC family protein n=1 Tax=Allorhizobium pseudoryzae TaxID=379684 RepID=UPI0013EB1F16|nr:VOC family protein [Allorhizobium pseudoryzae]